MFGIMLGRTNYTTLLILLSLVARLPPVSATDVPRLNGNFSSLSDAVWQLSNLDFLPATALHKSTSLGGQNTTHCCLLALNESLEVKDGYLVKKEPCYLDSSIEEFLKATHEGQFPCTATWNGDLAGAPIVTVPAGWLEATCPGWQLSDSKRGHESQWITPFVGFILPSVVFVLVIPRRWKLAVWNQLFVQDLSRVLSWIMAPLAMIVAGICVCTDTILWLCFCFAFASPMVLSGFYEAYLDSRIIGFLKEKISNYRLTLDMRARLLFVVLVGNLDLDPAIIEGDQNIAVFNRGKHTNDDERWPNFAGTYEDRNPSSPWTHIQDLVSPLRTYRDTALGTPRQYPLHNVQCTKPNCNDADCKETPLPRTAFVLREIGKTKTRLRTMLATQLSFGSSVGAPVVFFLGAFSFTIVTTLGSLGDENTSLDLAFGMWYMVIPHISIISGLLLAGNNPNTLEGVMALELGEIGEQELEKKSFPRSMFSLAYDSRYRPRWLWERGRSKQDWINRLISTYEFRAPSGRRGKEVPDEDMTALRKATTMTFTSWFIVLGMTALLMGVPFLLAFITAWFTPQIGLSCRSLTFLVYAITQFCQVVLWMWAYAGPPTNDAYFQFLRKGGFLDRKGFYDPTSVKSITTEGKFWSLQSLWAIIWYNLAVLFGLGGVFTSIGGTMMQLMGVYTSPKCMIDAQYWTKPHVEIPIIVSVNYALQIADAKNYWIPCAITAILFLGLISFCGWWYQRRLRGLFRNLVSELGSMKTEREDVRAAMPTIEEEAVKN